MTTKAATRRTRTHLTRWQRARRYTRARLKALAGGIGALLVFATTALLLAPDLQKSVTAWAPDWLRPVLPFVFVVGTAWAIERTRNRPATAEE